MEELQDSFLNLLYLLPIFGRMHQKQPSVLGGGWAVLFAAAHACFPLNLSQLSHPRPARCSSLAQRPCLPLALVGIGLAVLVYRQCAWEFLMVCGVSWVQLTGTACWIGVLPADHGGQQDWEALCHYRLPRRKDVSWQFSGRRVRCCGHDPGVGLREGRSVVPRSHRRTCSQATG